MTPIAGSRATLCLALLALAPTLTAGAAQGDDLSILAANPDKVEAVKAKIAAGEIVTRNK